MESQALVRNWLADISAAAGIGPLTLDEQGRGAFDYGGALRMHIGVPAGSGIVQLWSPLVPLPEEERGTFCERLLKANFLTLETNGATLAIDDHTGEVALCYSQPVQSLDSQGFRNLLGSFLESVQKWTARLESAPAPAALDGIGNSDGNSGGVLPEEAPERFGIRV